MLTVSFAPITSTFRCRNGFAQDPAEHFRPDSGHHNATDVSLGRRADPAGSQLVDGIAVLFPHSGPGELAVVDSGNFANETPNESFPAGRAAGDVTAGGESLDSADS